MRTLVKKVIPASAFHKIEPYGHLGEAMLMQVRHGFPGKGLKIIGVTGTDGKTSTCTLITAMLRSNGYKVAMMTTISVDYGDGRGARPNPTRLTTMGVSALLSRIKKVKASGAEWLVLEVTSHALAQHRVWALPFTIGVLTNLGHEHLDYHGTFQRYREAKRLLFKHVNRNRHGLQVGIANADDPSGELFARTVAHPVRYGVKQGDLRAYDIKLTPGGSTYVADFNGETYTITCHLPGSFNVYNSLAAVGVGQAVGLTKKQIEQGIASLKSVEGRMTHIDEGQDFTVIVDYAHTPESFAKLFKEIRPLAKGRLIAVFGSAGRRDEAKRGKQGEIAGRDCDIVIVTEEDDRDIDGQEIMEHIAKGAERAGKVKNKNLFLVHEREQAVQRAVGMAKKGDIVVLLGKGHEKSILTNGPKAAELRHLQQDDTDSRRVTKRDYDEIAVAHAALRKRKK
ncbi:MAG TPA: UDP-N-acetylmuramoyl-L-alanyl-D-glutamate--2,6-diaminopimelate ligase [Candidatus Saccharimonadales bacterium]|nr:UDP-N-acetylmuramoyl-L-alanyl-D-glutamate--2,6-diaminopimelate ligase [Candidatus Saccharimonadales bacterium]